MTSLINSELNDAGQGDVPEASLVSRKKRFTVYVFFKFIMVYILDHISVYSIYIYHIICYILDKIIELC